MGVLVGHAGEDHVLHLRVERLERLVQLDDRHLEGAELVAELLVPGVEHEHLEADAEEGEEEGDDGKVLQHRIGTTGTAIVLRRRGRRRRRRRGRRRGRAFR